MCQVAGKRYINVIHLTIPREITNFYDNCKLYCVVLSKYLLGYGRLMFLYVFAGDAARTYLESAPA